MFGIKRSVFFLTFVLSLLCLGERFFKEEHDVLPTSVVLFNEVPIGTNLMWRISYDDGYNPVYTVESFESLSQGSGLIDTDFDFVNMFALYPYNKTVYSRMDNQFCEYRLATDSVGATVNKVGCKAIPFTGETIIGIAFDRNGTTAVLTNKNLRLYGSEYPFFPSMTDAPFFTFSLAGLTLDTTNVTRIHYAKSGVVFTQSSKQYIIAFDYSTGSLVGKIPKAETDNERFKIDLAVPTDDGFVFSAGMVIVCARYDPKGNNFIRTTSEVPTVLHGKPSEFLFDEVSRNVYVFTENNLTRISLNNFVVSGLDLIHHSDSQDPVQFSHPKVFFGNNGYLHCTQSRKNSANKLIFEVTYIQTSDCPGKNKLSDCVNDSDYCEFNLRLKDETSGSCREKTVKHESGWVDFIPTITKITPNRASTYGGTDITVTLDVDLASVEQNGVECIMNNKPIEGTYDSKNKTITCETPKGFSEGEIPIDVRYKVSGQVIRTISRFGNHVEETKFLFYKCDHDDKSVVSPCSRCYITTDSSVNNADDNECAWSLKDQKCVNKNNKTLGADVIYVNKDECMVISSISPDEFDEGKSVNFVLDFEADKKWKEGVYKCALYDGNIESQQVKLEPELDGNGKICSFTSKNTERLGADIDLNLRILYSAKEGEQAYPYITLSKPNASTIKEATVKMTSCVSYTNCHSCALRTGCFWSLKDDGSFECADANKKSKTYSIEKTSSCPSVLDDSYVGFLPKESAEEICKSDPKKINVTIPILNLYSGLNPSCSKDNSNWVKATVSGSSVICEIPLTCPVSVDTESFDVNVSVSESRQLYVKVPFSIAYCGEGIDDMTTCLSKDPNGHCGFDMKKKKGECKIQTQENLVSGSWTNKAPYITNKEMKPEELDYFDLQNKPIDIPVSFIPVNSERQFYCKMLAEDNSLIANTTNVDVSNTNKISCTFGVADVQNSLRVFGATDGSPDTVIHIDDIIKHDKIFVSFGELDNENSPFNSLDKMEVAVVDCLAKNTTLSCGACLDIESSDGLKHCGWSVSAGMCMSDYHLKSEQYGILPGGSCPGFSRIDPVSRDKGEFTLDVYGNGFVNIGIEVVFVGKSDNKMYNFTSTFVNSSHLKVSVSSGLPIQQYEIILWYKNKPFTETGNIMAFTITKPPLPFWIWIIVGVGGFLIIAAIFVIIIVVIRRRGGLSTFKFDVSEKPDLSQFAYIRPLQGKKGGSELTDDQKAQLAGLLKDTTVAAAIYKAQDASSTDNVAAAMVYINSYNGCGLKFVETLAKKEVEGTKTVEQLFRESTLATKAASAYLRMKGIEYLWNSLALFVNELNYIVKKQQGSSSEAEKPVDLDEDGGNSTSSAAGLEAERLGAASGEDLELRRYLFEQRARNLVLCVNSSSGDVPPEIHYLIFASKQESVNKFGDDAAVSAAIGLLFMRLLCPALHDPQEYALLVDKTHKTALEPSGVLRQQLGFMSTLLLNLAGRRIFQGKDAFLSELNDFVVANMDTIGSYIDAVSTPSSYTESGVAVPQNVLQNSYTAIAEAVENTFPKMKRYLNEQQRSDLAQACGIEA